MTDDRAKSAGARAPGAAAAPRRRGRPRGSQERRARILRSALAVFAEVGYERATLREIVQRAGTSKGALYHYFESKDAVLLAVLREFLASPLGIEEDLVARTEPAVPVEELLERLIGRIWNILQDPDRIALARLMVSEAPKVPEVGRIYFDEVVARGRETLRAAILHGRAPDTTELDGVEAEAAMVGAMLVGAALILRALEPFDPAPRDPAQTGRLVARIIARGVTPMREARR